MDANLDLWQTVQDSLLCRERERDAILDLFLDFNSFSRRKFISLETFPYSILYREPTEVVLECVCDLKGFISDVIQNKIHLKPALKGVQKFLESIHSALTIMSAVDLKLDLPVLDIYRFLSVLEEAHRLVCIYERQESSVVAERMKELEDSMANFYLVDMRNLLRNNLNMSGQLSEEKAYHNHNLSRKRKQKFHGMIVGPRHPVEELKLLLEEDGLPLVITGPPGYGKTTLVENLCKDTAIKDKYADNIFNIHVSETPDEAAIVSQLCEVMNLQLYEKIPSGTLNIMELEIFIKNMEISHMLLILDDVWGEWESLIDKFNFRIPGYKLLVTSRFRFPRFEGYELTRLCENNGQPLCFQNGKRHLDPNNQVAELPLLMWERRPKNNSGEGEEPVYVENLEGMTKSVALFDMFDMDDCDGNVLPSKYLESRVMGDSSAQE